jgi:hypothetical protein
MSQRVLCKKRYLGSRVYVLCCMLENLLGRHDLCPQPAAAFGPARAPTNENFEVSPRAITHEPHFEGRGKIESICKRDRRRMLRVQR